MTRIIFFISITKCVCVKFIWEFLGNKDVICIIIFGWLPHRYTRNSKRNPQKFLEKKKPAALWKGLGLGGKEPACEKPGLRKAFDLEQYTGRQRETFRMTADGESAWMSGWIQALA